MTTATQLTITIPDGASAGSLLSIPIKGVNGTTETIKARVPEGLGPGCTLVLTKLAGSDQWVEEKPDPASSSSGGNHAQSQSQLQAAHYAAQQQMQQQYQQQQQQHQQQQQLQVQHQHHMMTTMPVEAPLPEPLPATVLGPVAHTVRLDTTVGIIDIIVRPDWAPHGARRFLELASAGDLEDLAFYRAVKGCLAQFGLPPKRQWPPLPDDPPTGVPFLLGAVCFAAVGVNSRKSTLFICTGDMSHCFGQSPWETPIGAVAESSLDALDRIETCYGDISECGGQGPNTGRIHDEGTAYLRREFPRLTHIRSAWCLDWSPDDASLARLPPLLQARSQASASSRSGPVSPETAQVCSCGNHFLPDSDFCPKCGLARHRRESQQACACGTVFASDSLFCRKCGTPRLQQASAASRNGRANQGPNGATTMAATSCGQTSAASGAGHTSTSSTAHTIAAAAACASKAAASSQANGFGLQTQNRSYTPPPIVPAGNSSSYQPPPVMDCGVGGGHSVIVNRSFTPPPILVAGGQRCSSSMVNVPVTVERGRCEHQPRGSSLSVPVEILSIGDGLGRAPRDIPVEVTASRQSVHATPSVYSAPSAGGVFASTPLHRYQVVGSTVSMPVYPAANPAPSPLQSSFRQPPFREGGCSLSHFAFGPIGSLPSSCGASAFPAPCLACGGGGGSLQAPPGICLPGLESSAHCGGGSLQAPPCIGVPGLGPGGCCGGDSGRQPGVGFPPAGFGVGTSPLVGFPAVAGAFVQRNFDCTVVGPLSSPFDGGLQGIGRTPSYVPAPCPQPSLQMPLTIGEPFQPDDPRPQGPGHGLCANFDSLGGCGPVQRTPSYVPPPLMPPPCGFSGSPSSGCGCFDANVLGSPIPFGMVAGPMPMMSPMPFNLGGFDGFPGSRCGLNSPAPLLSGGCGFGPSPGLNWNNY